MNTIEIVWDESDERWYYSRIDADGETLEAPGFGCHLNVCELGRDDESELLAMVADRYPNDTIKRY